MMDLPEIRMLARVAGLDRALALFPEELAQAAALVLEQRGVLYAQAEAEASRPPDPTAP